MPQGEPFWNPYRMVPVREEKPSRKAPVTHESFRGESGYIVCNLTTLTPFLIGGPDQGNVKLFLQKNGQPVIPGTSLKGMIRALAEIMGNGCSPVGTTDANHRPCQDNRSLCISCRMFGMMSREERGGVFMGKVSFGDGALASNHGIYNSLPRHSVLLGTPSPRHAVFYRNPISGQDDKTVRKFYFHQVSRIAAPASPPKNLADRAWLIKPLPKDIKFEFTVSFQNLESEEMALLLYSLFLEEKRAVEFTEPRGYAPTGPLRHKLGYGKPIGMGSVHIQPDRLVLQDAGKRYRDENSETILKDDKLKKEIETRTDSLRKDSSPTMEYLSKMLLWDTGDRRDFRYPAYDWFKDLSQPKPYPPHPINCKKPLKRI